MPHGQRPRKGANSPKTAAQYYSEKIAKGYQAKNRYNITGAGARRAGDGKVKGA